MTNQLNLSPYEVHQIAKRVKTWTSEIPDSYYGYLENIPSIDLRVFMKCSYFENSKPSIVSIVVESGSGNSKAIIGVISRSKDPDDLKLYQHVGDIYKQTIEENKAKSREAGLKKARELLG